MFIQILLIKERPPTFYATHTPLPVRMHVLLQLPSGEEFPATYPTFVHYLSRMFLQVSSETEQLGESLPAHFAAVLP